VIGPHRPDLVLIFGEGHAPAGREVSRDAGAPLVAALRSDRIAELDAVGRAERGIGPRVPRRRFERALVRIREQGIARAASRVVFQTDRDRQAFTARNPASRGHTAVIPNSIDASWFDPGLRDANRSTELRRLIFVGNLIARKGVLSLVVAFQRLVSDGLDLSLEICGDGPLRAQLERFVTGHQLSDRVALRGAVSDALRRIADADLLVLPSLYDSFPNVVLEALHTGTPALATRAGGAAEIIRQEDLLVAPQDSDALAAAVRRLSRDRTVYAAAREHMRRRRAEFEFDWVGRFESILQGVVASPGAG
jgi:glycosyltransferase involved in cell wall biosynthesis